MAIVSMVINKVFHSKRSKAQEQCWAAEASRPQYLGMVKVHPIHRELLGVLQELSIRLGRTHSPDDGRTGGNEKKTTETRMPTAAPAAEGRTVGRTHLKRLREFSLAISRIFITHIFLQKKKSHSTFSHMPNPFLSSRPVWRSLWIYGCVSRPPLTPLSSSLLLMICLLVLMNPPEGPSTPPHCPILYLSQIITLISSSCQAEW